MSNEIVATVESILQQYNGKAPGKSVRIMIEAPVGKQGLVRRRVTLRYVGDGQYKLVCPACSREADALYFMPPKTIWCDCWEEHGQRAADSSEKPHSHN
jgi:hypothetical protein